YGILQNQFAGDRGNKEASKEVSEEKRKEKEALRLEREKEIEDRRKQDEERAKQQEIIKAKAVVTGPKQVGTIDLEGKKAAPKAEATPAPDPAPEKVAPVETPPAPAPKAPEEEAITTQYQKLSG